MINYAIQYKKDSVEITNSGSEILKYNLSLLVCGKDISRAEGTIKPSSKVELKFLASDGVYKLSISDNVDTESVSFSYYGNTLKMILNSIEKICGTLGCSCKDNKTVACKDTLDSCNTLLQPLVMSLSYYFLDPSKYNKVLDYLSVTLNCNITELISCIISTNSVIGKSDFKELAEQLSIIFYTCFYVDALINSQTEEEIEATNKLYRISEFEDCIRKFGIDIDTIMDNMIDKESINVYFWKEPIESQDTIEDLNFGLTQEKLDTHTYKEIDLFLQGINLPFNSLGKIVFVIKNPLNLSFQIEDYLGNDITDLFFSTYNVGLSSTVFLSKIPYSVGEIYFKFKQNFL